MQKNKERFTASEKKLVLMCVAVYFVSYITRINYAAVLVEFVKSTGFSKESASLALTGLAIFYGGGQLVSGWLGDRVKPKLLISCGLFISAAMNFLLPFCTAVPALTAVWCINGLAQAMMWPPIVKILTCALTADKYKKASVKVSYGAQAATILIYLFAPICIRFSGWQTIFFTASVCAVIMAVVVAVFAPDIKNPQVSGMPLPENAADKSSCRDAGSGRTAFPYFIFGAAMFVTVLQGIMRDGVANWLPTYIENEFGVSTELAILSGVVPPLFAVVCYEITSLLSRKVLKNEFVCAAVIFGTGFAAAFILSIFSSHSILLSVAMSTVINGCMHGVNVILTCMIPPYFIKNGKVSFIAGLINSCTYAGSALSGYGFAVITEMFGWKGTIAGWTVICALAAIICVVFSRKWGNFCIQNSDDALNDKPRERIDSAEEINTLQTNS